MVTTEHINILSMTRFELKNYDLHERFNSWKLPVLERISHNLIKAKNYFIIDSSL